MKMTIITDSLGMPRESIEVEDTWVEKILEKYHNDFIIYTFPMRTRHTRDVAYNDYQDLISYQKSDIFIIQLGIVDACRRVMPRRASLIVPYLPVIGKIVHHISSKYHYQLTRLYQCKYVNEDLFRENIKKIANGINSKQANMIWIKIAGPSGDLVKKTFNAKNDVEKYNQILEQCSREFGFDLIDPYSGYNEEDVVLKDGHHLTVLGNQLVFRALDEKLNEMILKEIGKGRKQ